MMESRFTLHHGDALDVLRTLDAGSADSLVTDPPSGIAFMGAEWDRNKGGRAAWVAWLAEILAEARRVLRPGAQALVWALPRTSHWTATAVEDAGFKVVDVVVHLQGQGFPKSKSLLKPAAEHWILARAPGPLRELGIDACRIGTGGDKGVWPITDRARDSVAMGDKGPVSTRTDTGRWPANCVLSHVDGPGGCEQIGTKRVRGSHDTGPNGIRRNATMGYGGDSGGTVGAGFVEADGLETVDAWRCADGCPVAELDAQSGERPGMSGGGSHRGDYGGGMFGGIDSTGTARGDTGGASRFFFCSKPSRAERSAGLDGKNHHPTVKSIELMRWLVRLVTPPGGTVLDPFAGTGTTGIAALAEQMRFIGIERDEGFAAIARRRLENECGPLFAAVMGGKP